MKPAALISAIAIIVMNISGYCSARSQLEKARVRMDDLRFGSYATSRHVEQLATDEAVRNRAWDTIRSMGITKLYIEVYRGGHVVSPEHLIFVRNWLREKDIDVVAIESKAADTDTESGLGESGRSCEYDEGHRR